MMTEIDAATTKGFILTAKNVNDRQDREPPTMISPGQFGDLMAAYIRERLGDEPSVRIALTIETREDLHEVFETQYLVRPDRPAATAQDFTRNYWVETSQ
jgi:hypothetical protein